MYLIAAMDKPNDSDDGKQAKGVRIVLIEVLVDGNYAEAPKEMNLRQHINHCKKQHKDNFEPT